MRVVCDIAELCRYIAEDGKRINPWQISAESDGILVWTKPIHQPQLKSGYIVFAMSRLRQRQQNVSIVVVTRTGPVIFCDGVLC